MLLYVFPIIKKGKLPWPFMHTDTKLNVSILRENPDLGYYDVLSLGERLFC